MNYISQLYIIIFKYLDKKEIIKLGTVLYSSRSRLVDRHGDSCLLTDVKYTI